MLRKRKPPSAANAATAMTVADEKGTDRKKRRSMSGWTARRSQTKKRPSETAATVNAPMMTADDIPFSGSSMIP